VTVADQSRVTKAQCRPRGLQEHGACAPYRYAGDIRSPYRFLTAQETCLGELVLGFVQRLGSCHDSRGCEQSEPGEGISLPIVCGYGISAEAMARHIAR